MCYYCFSSVRKHLMFIYLFFCLLFFSSWCIQWKTSAKLDLSWLQPPCSREVLCYSATTSSKLAKLRQSNIHGVKAALTHSNTNKQQQKNIKLNVFNQQFPWDVFKSFWSHNYITITYWFWQNVECSMYVLCEINTEVMC